MSVDTIKLLTFHLAAFLNAGSIFESNFCNISEISGCLDVTEIKSLSWRILLWKKINHWQSSYDK